MNTVACGSSRIASRVEARAPDHPAARQQRAVDRDEQSVHVEDRQHVQQHVAGAPAPVAVQHPRVAADVAVREHRALAAAGRSRRVDDAGEVLGAAAHRREAGRLARRGFEQRAAAVVAQREQVRHAMATRDRLDPAQVRGAADDHRRLGVRDEVVDLGGLVGGVQRQERIAGAQRREIEQHRLGRLVDLHRDPCALRELQSLEQVRDHRARALDVVPAVPGALAGVDAAARAVGRETGGQHRVEVVIAWFLHGRVSVGRLSAARQSSDSTARDALTWSLTNFSWLLSISSRSYR